MTGARPEAGNHTVSATIGAMSALQTAAPDTQLVSEAEAALQMAIERHLLAPRLREAMQYATLGGGKRVRPLLTLRACEAVGGDRADAMPAAIALEMIHCFSLVHDDLPALDNDDLRRGRPTTHRAHGEALAILAGDALTSVAVEVALGSRRRPADIARELASATTAMIAGQVYDTLGGFPGTPDAAAKLRLIHDNKTGALIRCACRMGALCGGADEARLASLSRYGEAMGLMFQVVDDILDETQSTEHLGKAAGKDRDAGKMTYPGVFGLDESRRHVERLLSEALAALAPRGEAADPLRAMASALATRTR
jgi:geranylgeranyl diphosphate synthase type II